jgi:signal transduction histidine kinase
MTPRERLREGLPLTVWAGLGSVFVACLALGVTAGVLAVDGRLDARAVHALTAGFGVAAAAGWLAAVGASRMAAGLRELRTDAVRRLHDPAGSVARRQRLAVRSSVELRALARTLDALYLRVRVADDVALRHRRTAETASVGIYELLSGLVAAEEGARGQLAAELHDSVAQTLMAARSMLSMEQLDHGEVQRAGELVAEAEDQVRAVMARTRPPALRDGDLAAAVSALRDDMFARYGLQVRVSWPSEPHPLPLVVATTVYRFFQEALLNVVKHADVDEAFASLAVHENAVTATVSDKGPGFDPDEVRPDRGRHIGLGLLRERARLAGGSLEIDSWPGDGTTLTLRLPRGVSSSALRRSA